MIKFINKFARDEAGATAVEYGLIAMLISIAIIGILGSIGISLRNTFTLVNNGFSH